MFASWASEEYGAHGSLEWVYDTIHKLTDRAVAVINVDICAFGGILGARASPIMKEVLLEALRVMPSTYDPSVTYHDFLVSWLAKGEDTKNTTIEDFVGLLDAGSDHAAFTFYAGVPAVDFGFE